MLELLVESTLEATSETTATLEGATLQSNLEPLSEVATTPHEGGTNSHPPIWEPTDPQFTKAIADYYSVTRKTVQEWFQKIKEACPWFPEADLKLPDERHTPMAIQLMGRYRTSGLPFKAWKARIWDENSELVAAFQASQSTDPIDNSSGDRPRGAEPSSSNTVMVPYQPQTGEVERFTPPERKIFKFTSTEEFTATAKQNAETALDVTQDNSNSLTDALVNQMQQEGQKLGLTLFQAKYGTAHSVLAELEQTLAKKSGLVEEAHHSTTG